MEGKESRKVSIHVMARTMNAGRIKSGRVWSEDGTGMTARRALGMQEKAHR